MDGKVELEGALQILVGGESMECFMQPLNCTFSLQNTSLQVQCFYLQLIEM